MELNVPGARNSIAFRHLTTTMVIRDSAGDALAEHRELYSGLIRLHLLYHASKEPIFGLQMIEELGRHGYKLSPGTLYPLLHGLENKGLLRSTRPGSRNDRRVYRATPAGRKALAGAKQRVQELFSELFEDVLALRPEKRRKEKS